MANSTIPCYQKWFWTRFVKFCKCIFVISLLSLSGSGHCPLIVKKIAYLSSRDALCQHCTVEIREEDKDVKRLQRDPQTDGQTTNNTRSDRLTWAIRLSELQITN